MNHELNELMLKVEEHGESCRKFLRELILLKKIKISHSLDLATDVECIEIVKQLRIRLVRGEDGPTYFSIKADRIRH